MAAAEMCSSLGKWIKNNDWEQLTEENILETFVTGFRDPGSFQVKHYNLTNTYETFWTKFAGSTYSEGDGKFPNSSLPQTDLTSLARILERGWQDERYLTTVLPVGFLRSCIFNEEPFGDVRVIEVFREVLNDLLSVDEFNFVIKEREGLIEKHAKTLIAKTHSRSANQLYDDLDGFEEDLPHKLWTTFFFQWKDDMVKFYFETIHKGSRFKCLCCGEVDKKHIMGTALSTDLCRNMRKLSGMRRHSVLTMIIDKFNQAKNKEGTFCHADDWRALGANLKRDVQKTGINYEWPKLVLKMHDVPFLEYSMQKRTIVILNLAVRWDHWIKTRLEEKKLQKKNEADLLEKIEELRRLNEFDVKFENFQISCRGIFCRDLYRLFSDDFHMEHGEISKTLENLSKELIGFPYSYGPEHYYLESR